ncbi:hypothetical protein AYO49_03200 [Verrucomicrobiaceae bacterium SCGC AG-212-N21]|nr:hypothetical protein AYO49_03200 [Verrucomicrobiaceae bacterium SCGC AG-212-N21]
MVVDDALYERVKKFTMAQLWDPKGGIAPETRLAADFGIAGLDGKEFMEAYAQEFDVDITGFDWIDYFGPEGSGCLCPLPFARWLDIYDPRDSARWGRDAADFEICMRDLAEWAATGAWTPPHTRGSKGVT